MSRFSGEYYTSLYETRFLQTLSQLQANGKGQHKLYQISRKKGNHAGRQSLGKGEGGLIGKPCSAEKIAAGCAKEHSRKKKQDLIGKTVHKKTTDKSHKKKAYDIPSCGAKQLSGAAAEAREHRKPCKPQKHINDHADGSTLHAKNGNHKIDRHRAKRDRNGTYGDCKGNGAQNTDYRSHQAHQGHLLCVWFQGDGGGFLIHDKFLSM